MHLDSSNSEAIDSMSRESIQTGWIHHLAHNFTNAASNVAAASGHSLAGLQGVGVGNTSTTHPSFKFAAAAAAAAAAADQASPTSLKMGLSESSAHQSHSPISVSEHNSHLNPHPHPHQHPHPHHTHFTELRSAQSAAAAAAAASVDSAGSWPPSIYNPSSMMHPVVSSRNSFSAVPSPHPNASSWAHARSAYGTSQFASAEQVAAAYRTGCNLNIMNAVVGVGGATGATDAAAAHHHQSTAAAAAAAMHAMPFYMTGPPVGMGMGMGAMGVGGSPMGGVNPHHHHHHHSHPHHQNPFVSPHNPYAASVAAAEMYNDHTSSTFRYNPTTGKTRTKDKYRVVYTDRQRAELENEFRSAQYITIRRKSELAMQVGLSERQVKIWFQNRRAKERKVSRKVPGGGAGREGGLNSSSEVEEDSDNEELEEEEEEEEGEEERDGQRRNVVGPNSIGGAVEMGAMRSPSKHQTLSPAGCHNGLQQLPLIKADHSGQRLRSPTAASVNELYMNKLS